MFNVDNFGSKNLNSTLNSLVNCHEENYLDFIRVETLQSNIFPILFFICFDEIILHS